MANIYTYQTVFKNVYRSYFLEVIVYIFCLLFLLSESINSQTLSAEQIYEKVKDAVVVILAYDYSNELAVQGSGVVLNDKGYVVTNYHVLSGNERLEIMHGEEIIPYVDIIGIDVEKDLLILKIDEKKFPSIKIGDTNKLKVGQRVYAIGSPMGFENTISEGIISGLRSYDETNKNYIQITASISPGSSGGAVVNDKGELIGISSSTIEEGQNLNFAIPIDDALSVEIGSYMKNDKFKNFELFQKGLDAWKKGNFNIAIEYYTRYIQIHPTSFQAYYNRALVKTDLGDYIGALQDYSKAIELNPFDSHNYSARGVLKLNYFNDYRGAVQDFNKVIEIDPDNALAFYNRGVAHFYLGNENDACSDWSKSGELGFYEAYETMKENCH